LFQRIKKLKVKMFLLYFILNIINIFKICNGFIKFYFLFLLLINVNLFILFFIFLLALFVFAIF